ARQQALPAEPHGDPHDVGDVRHRRAAHAAEAAPASVDRARPHRRLQAGLLLAGGDRTRQGQQDRRWDTRRLGATHRLRHAARRLALAPQRDRRAGARDPAAGRGPAYLPQDARYPLHLSASPAQLNRTYSKVAGWFLMQRWGGAIQLANLLGSITAWSISEVPDARTSSVCCHCPARALLTGSVITWPG